MEPEASGSACECATPCCLFFPSLRVGTPARERCASPISVSAAHMILPLELASGQVRVQIPTRATGPFRVLPSIRPSAQAPTMCRGHVLGLVPMELTDDEPLNRYVNKFIVSRSKCSEGPSHPSTPPRTPKSPVLLSKAKGTATLLRTCLRGSVL